MYFSEEFKCLQIFFYSTCLLSVEQIQLLKHFMPVLAMRKQKLLLYSGFLRLFRQDDFFGLSWTEIITAKSQKL